MKLIISLKSLIELTTVQFIKKYSYLKVVSKAMETINYECKKIRSRGVNWAQEDKDLFLEIMSESATIVESKLTDTNANRRKNLEWQKIQQRLEELTGKHRELMQIKGFWKRMKLAAKKSISTHRKAVHATGGGQRPPSPLPEQLKILELCPTDFVSDENIFDCDSIPQATSLQAPSVSDNTVIIVDNNSHDSTIHDLEEDLEYTKGPMDTINKEHIEQEKHLVYDPPITSQVNQPKDQNKRKKNLSKADVIESNMLIKKKAIELIEKEHNLKILFQRRELAHQRNRQKLEIEILNLEKEVLKKKISKE